ncbi:MAG: GNAT family N-acetyltransferase [Acidimicrobiales bacterium]|jgi:hypothetical protein
MSAARLVPDDFSVPQGVSTDRFRLEPLAQRHNVADHKAWTSSIDHIRSTPGFAGRTWPNVPLSVEENAVDIAEHEADFAARSGFTYTVLEAATGDVIGCVYLYPPRRQGFDVDARSWVRAESAALDQPLHDLVRQWLIDEWPFHAPDYAQRPAAPRE